MRTCKAQMVCRKKVLLLLVSVWLPSVWADLPKDHQAPPEAKPADPPTEALSQPTESTAPPDNTKDAEDANAAGEQPEPEKALASQATPTVPPSSAPPRADSSAQLVEPTANTSGSRNGKGNKGSRRRTNPEPQQNSTAPRTSGAGTDPGRPAGPPANQDSSGGDLPVGPSANGKGQQSGETPDPTAPGKPGSSSSGAGGQAPKPTQTEKPADSAPSVGWLALVVVGLATIPSAVLLLIGRAWAYKKLEEFKTNNSSNWSVLTQVLAKVERIDKESRSHSENVKGIVEGIDGAVKAGIKEVVLQIQGAALKPSPTFELDPGSPETLKHDGVEIKPMGLLKDRLVVAVHRYWVAQSEGELARLVAIGGRTDPQIVTARMPDLHDRMKDSLLREIKLIKDPRGEWLLGISQAETWVAPLPRRFTVSSWSLVQGLFSNCPPLEAPEMVLARPCLVRKGRSEGVFEVVKVGEFAGKDGYIGPVRSGVEPWVSELRNLPTLIETRLRAIGDNTDKSMDRVRDEFVEWSRQINESIDRANLQAQVTVDKSTAEFMEILRQIAMELREGQRRLLEVISELPGTLGTAAMGPAVTTSSTEPSSQLGEVITLIGHLASEMKQFRETQREIVVMMQHSRTDLSAQSLPPGRQVAPTSKPLIPEPVGDQVSSLVQKFWAGQNTAKTQRGSVSEIKADFTGEPGVDSSLGAPPVGDQAPGQVVGSELAYSDSIEILKVVNERLAALDPSFYSGSAVDALRGRSLKIFEFLRQGGLEPMLIFASMQNSFVQVRPLSISGEALLFPDGIPVSSYELLEVFVALKDDKSDLHLISPARLGRDCTESPLIVVRWHGATEKDMRTLFQTEEPAILTLEAGAYRLSKPMSMMPLHVPRRVS